MTAPEFQEQHKGLAAEVRTERNTRQKKGRRTGGRHLRLKWDGVAISYCSSPLQQRGKEGIPRGVNSLDRVIRVGSDGAILGKADGVSDSHRPLSPSRKETYLTIQMENSSNTLQEPTPK